MSFLYIIEKGEFSMKNLAQGFKHLLLPVGLALVTQGAWAADLDLLNLGALDVDDTSIGLNTIIKRNDIGEKYLTGYNSEGQFLVPANMPMESEIRIRMSMRYSINYDTSIFLLADEYKVQLYINAYRSKTLSGNALVEGTSDESGAWMGGSINTVRIALTNGEVKVYFNDVFSQKAKLLDPNLTFTQLQLSSIDPSYTAIYELKASGGVTTAYSNTCDITGGGGGSPALTSSATLDAALGMHIPSLIYTPLGGQPMNLRADLQFAPGVDGSLNWKLSNYGVNQ
jgi:hypothetical protein